MSDEKTTRANVPAPPKSKRTSFLPDNAPSAPADNMRGEKQVSMTFNMDLAWHREFKATAAMHGVSMKDLLIQGFELWKDAHKGK